MALDEVTKTGPVGLKGLKGVDRINEMSNEEYDAFISSFKAPSREAIKLAGALSMGEDVEFSTGQDLGDSRYDKPILSQEEVENISEYRASEQAWYDKLANGLGKALVLAGTTFIDSTVGTIVGATSAVAEQKFSNLWDNPISRAMLEVNEWSERVLPNYYSEEEQKNNANGEWYKNVFTANFWGDKFLKNMGFTLGAVATGAATGSLLKGAIGKAAKYTLGKQASDAAVQNASSFVRANVGAAVASIGESKIEALHSADDWYNLQKAKLDDKYKPLFDSIEQYKKEPDLYNSLASSINEEYELELAKLNDLKAKVGNVTFGLNVPLTYGTNMIAWGKLFSGGYNTAASSLNISKRFGKYVSDTTPIGVISGSLAEGTQEMSQKAAATIPGLKYEDELEAFYNANTDDDATSELMSWSKAFAKGIIDTVSDPNSWEEFTLGALTKVFGTPMIRRNNGKLSIGIEGSIVDDYREYKKQKDLENSMVATLNDRIESEEFKNYYDGLTRHIKYQNDMNEAAENKDAHAYKNAEDSQLISDIIMFDKAGRLNDLVEMVNDATELSDENIQSIIENTTDADGNGPFSQNGNVLPKEEIVKKVNERKDNILKQIDTYRRVKDRINREIGDNITEEQLGELTWLNVKSIRNYERLDNLAEELRPLIRTIAADMEYTTPKEADTVEQLRTLSDNPVLLAKLLKDNPEFITAIKESAKELDEDYNLDYEEKANKLDDIVKLYDAAQEFKKKYKEYAENPAKQAEDKAKSKEKAAKVNKASETIKKKDSITNKSVSEINKAIDNGEINEEDFADMFPDGLPDISEENEATETEVKVKTALDIRDKTNRIKAEIDKSDMDATTKNNAKKLIDNSKSISDSLDDLTDLSSESFNDPSVMFDPLDSSLEGLEVEELQDELEIRLGGAKDLLSEIISNIREGEKKVVDLPKEISEGINEAAVATTGHDSVDKNDPINKDNVKRNVKSSVAESLIQRAKDETDNAPEVLTLRDVIKDIDRLVNAGAIEKTIKNTIYKSESYKKVINGFPGLATSIDGYISDKLAERESSATKNKEVKKDSYNPNMEEDSVTFSSATSKELEVESNKEAQSLDKQDGFGGIYTSWSSTLTRYYRYNPKWDRTLFVEVAEKGDYSPEEFKRIKAIWNYLNNHNAFNFVDNNGVKEGDKITFTTNDTLNEEAGELVIIMEKEGDVIGVLPSPNDSNFNRYAGLSEFIGLFTEEYNEYKKSGKSEKFISKYTTSINKNMVGRVPYSKEYRTLNNIFTDSKSNGGSKDIPFELGISSGDGRNAKIIISGERKGTSTSTKRKQQTILSPLDAKKGQPYLLIKTSDPKRAYVNVPFIMPQYSQDTSDSALGKAIDNVLSSLVGLQAKDIMKVKREIQELLAIPELHINILKNGNLKIDAKFQGDNKQTNIYNGKIDNPNLVQEVKSKLYGTPFQVSRKYINDTYKGQDYNRMIGELAFTNIDGTHTIDDWFTINPIDKEGNEFKGKTQKSTRNNPNSAKPKVFEYTWKGIPLTVNLDTFEVIRKDKENTKIEGGNADKVRAIAYGFKTSKTGTYQTPWGWFNSETLEFVDEPKSENVVNRTFGLNESKPSELTLREATGETVKIVDSNTRPFNDSIVDSFINAFNNSSIEVPIDFINSQAENDRKYSIAEFLYRVAKKYGLTKSEQERVSNIMKQYPSADFGKRFPIYDNYLNEISKTIPSRPEVNNTFTTPEELEDKARKEGLISTAKRKALWKALNNSQQETLLNTKGMRREQLMKGLELAYDVKTNKFNMSKLKGSIENYLGMKPLYRRTTESKEQIRKRELKWLSRALPNLSEEGRVRVVNGLIKVAAEDGGGFAWGQFKQGIIEISNVAARGTVYHEAFHAVTHTLLNDSEYEELFKAGREKYGNLSEEAIEENLAEDFRRYMQLEEMPFVGRVVRLFRTLKHIIQNLLGKETHLNKMYYSISHGLYSNRKVSQEDYFTNNITRYRLIGEEGAYNLDKAEESNIRLDNLRVAKEMESKDKDAKSIKMATGWERGVDGLWRYEVADSTLKEVKVNLKNGYDIIPLSDIVEDEELFKAYPDLKNATILVSEGARTPNASGLRITIPASYVVQEGYNQEELDRVIQEEQDLANSEEFKDYYNFYHSKPGAEALKEYAATHPVVEKYNSISKRKKTLSRKFGLKEGILSPSIIGEDFVHELQHLIQDLEGFAKGSSPSVSGYSDYFKSAGEVEARNVSRRMSMSLEERRKTLASETEDVSRNDQLFFATSLNAYNIPLTTSRFQEIVDSVVNNATHTIKGRNNEWGKFVDSWKRDGVEVKGYRGKDNRYVVTSVEDMSEKAHYRKAISDDVKKDCAAFLANFGIKIEELQDYNSDVPLFDAISRVINVRSDEDITKGTAYAVAFMMQHHKTMNELILLKYGAERNQKNLRRSLRVRGDFEARLDKKARAALDVDIYLDEIAEDIAKELRKYYKHEPVNAVSNIIQKIWEVITNFFELLTPQARTKFSVLHDYTRYIANSIILNDKSIVLASDHKPSNHDIIEYDANREKAVFVNLEEALANNPYEEDIIVKMNKEGIALAGGASIAADRSLYRPAENPLHDLDFQASMYTREEIDKILDRLYPNNTHIRHITDLKHDNRFTETYLIMDRPFVIEKSGIAKKFNIYDKENGEYLGTYMESDLNLVEGVKGKFLDFFTGSDNMPFPNRTMVLNGKEYLIADARNALRAKAEWRRAKDIWDYARYVPEEMRAIMDLEAMNRDKSVKEKLSNAKIIWGHPAIGKTTYLETHDDIVEWDELVNEERNKFFREQIDPEHKLDIKSSEYKQLRSKYMAEWKEHPEYIQFLKEKWEWLKAKAKRENKRIFASPAPLLELFKDDFDLFVVIPEKEFLIRNQQRGGSYYGSLGWKQIIAERLVNVDKSKILETKDYFSEFMNKYALDSNVRRIEQYHRDKWMYGNLSDENKQYLADRGISISEYNRMSRFEKEVLFHCK